jgi:hypothetical protein
MTYKLNDIITLKITSGEEIVARLISESSEQLVIYKPLTLVPGPQGMALMQSLMSANVEADVVVNKNAVIMHTHSRDEMVSAWIEGTSGLKTPTKSSILMG